MNHRPHQGNVRRDVRIFILFDAGESSHKQIASQVTCEGMHCTTQTVRDALKRRERYRMFYDKQISRFLPVSHTVQE